ncbi:MAG: hypothetical protein GXP54_09375 [Deltaproteobacteria bacterium]|nr:hypothetical protein [Deltaproteobacteria bacterium]
MNSALTSVVCVVLLLTTAPARSLQASPNPKTAHLAITAFLNGDPLPDSVALPIDTGPQGPDSGRAWDVLLGLGVIAALLGIGFAIKKGQDRFNPILFTALILGLLYFFAVDDLFWKFAGVRVDEQGIAVKDHLTEPRMMKWSDLDDVSVSSGKAFPFFMDDTQIVLRAKDGTTLRIPRWVPKRGEIGRAIADHVDKTPR